MNTRDKGLENAVANNPIDQVIPDVQSTIDTRHIAIQSVGIRSVKYPVLIELQGQKAMPSVAEFEMTVFLPADQKGTHMSRFIALLEESQGSVLTVAGFRAMLVEMLKRLDAPSGRVKMELPYFLSKVAPISGVSSLMDYQLTLEGSASEAGQDIYLTVVVPVTSLCPCSKKISEYGAHNQRSHVTARVQLKEDVDIAQFISAIEQQASCELYGLLKRPDEKYVTERAYDNPKFVEDLVRDVAIAMHKFEQIGHYTVEAENFESIHNHSAYARIDRV
ncbi:GTP cyclohydrolase I [Limnobacter thiooxidans]|uniref:GTP cyclohydrolase FolE2 n=1 Tax=Limnobacter thiooxidans TaxID=131080 RepID=A0AA86MHQ4_9BURK|nr:GTP cyclohydrolase FolE2 [Limnobacter sp.]MCZ8014130.1 GTP cyclohydrolase FolE2 [Limnobacter sp.]RZS38176.1 GTP cyclohydrolase I [Limnobacter thiooxidans]BET25377.1 GTP cyclohydrolase FolE2 [Limnobacter thiooxidans]